MIAVIGRYPKECKECEQPKVDRWSDLCHPGLCIECAIEKWNVLHNPNHKNTNNDEKT
jgi:hypothetical protein